MISSPDDRRPPITPQLAMRVAILGGVALALFGIVFFRLWFLQVLSGDQYLAQASSNRVRNVVIQAPRGELRDRNGTTLVENRRSVSIVVAPPKLPQDQVRLHALYVRLSHVLGVSARSKPCTVGRRKPRLMDLQCLVEQKVFQLPYATVTVKSDVDPAQYTYLGERLQQFPGVSIEQVFLRSYPYREIGAQLFGTIGQISPAELTWPHFHGVRGGTLVGQSGLEYTYDHYLRGRDGATRVQVDASGQAKGYLRTRAPRQGNDLSLSIDLKLQKAGQQALQTGIGLANANGNPARAGAFVALDPRNGELLAMGSAPSFNPNILTRPITKARYDALLGAPADYPQIDRALASAYPVGSTFKVITAAAALATRLLTPSTVYVDTGTFKQGTLVRHNAGNASYGAVMLRDALKLSVDTFFYNLGALLNASPQSHPDGGALQAWAHKFGLGQRTGVDIGAAEVAGTVPSPRWREERNRLQAACTRDHTIHKDPRKRTFRGLCAYADGTNRPWTIGDNTSLAVGQGDFLATPLQMAVAYAAIENGGTIVKPHVGLAITRNDGSVRQRIEPGAGRRIAIPDLRTIREGLHAATSETGGTSADVFQGFPAAYPVYGKTGTAQFGPSKPDQSWYICYVPDAKRPIVVAVTIESGGFGAQAAAPAARLILSQWFGIKKQVVTGKSHTL
jgi:penicillin-binding protein 2